MMIDIYFIEFFIKKKYNMSLEQYFSVNRPTASKWRNKKFPDNRLFEFSHREGTIDILELVKKIY